MLLRLLVYLLLPLILIAITILALGSSANEAPTDEEPAWRRA